MNRIRTAASAVVLAAVTVTGTAATMAAMTPATAAPAPASSQQAPRWLHLTPAPVSVARDACGRWPKYGLGQHKRGQVIPGVEFSPVAPGGVRTDGGVICQDGHVALP